MRSGKLSRREAKIIDGEEPVDAKMQSSIGGIAAGGTWLQLLESEKIKEAIELVSVEVIFTRKLETKTSLWLSVVQLKC